MAMRIKPVITTFEDGMVVKVMGEEFDVKSPLAYFYAGLSSCIAHHVAGAAKESGLNEKRLEVVLTGGVEDLVFTDIKVIVHLNQPRDAKTARYIEAAALNCIVVQHLDPEIEIEVTVA